MDKYGVKIKGIVRCGEDFLIVKKWYDDRIDEPYQWEFLDTQMEEGETPKDACLRYVQDATGIYCSDATIPYTWVYKLGDNKFLGIAFLCEVQDEIVFLSEDLVECKWVKAGELKEYIKNRGMLADMADAGII